MGTYIVRRVLIMIPMLLAISILVFLMMHAAPGNAIGSILNPHIHDPQALIKQLEHDNGLDASLPVQYWHWLLEFVQGQWGFSFALHENVTTVVMPALSNTLLLALMAEIFILIIGIPIGIRQARNPYSAFDNTASVFSVLFFSIPYFIIAIFVLYFFAIRLNWFPTQGAVSTGTPVSGSLWDHVRHAFLPAISIAITSSALYSRYTRASMLGESRKDFVRTAYAKGLSESRTFNRHVFRNGMIPIVTQFGLDLGGLAGGAIILEGLFAYQGMGYVTIQAAQQRDYSVILATTMIIAFGVLIGNLIADIVYATVDPRIRYR